MTAGVVLLNLFPRPPDGRYNVRHGLSQVVE
jgi:hypothetical protein